MARDTQSREFYTLGLHKLEILDISVFIVSWLEDYLPDSTNFESLGQQLQCFTRSYSFDLFFSLHAPPD